MEEKTLTEKESIEIISRMIQETKEGMQEGSGNMFLLWGYLSTIVSLMIYLATMQLVIQIYFGFGG